MCIITFQKINTRKLSEDEINGFSNRNPDGYGIMYIDKQNKLQINKTLDSNVIVELYNQIYEKYNKSSPIVMHFRLGTGGGKRISNCHPMRVNEELGMVHNGVLVNTPSTDTKSDTYIFNKKICRPIGDNIFNKSVQLLVSDYISPSNKIVFLHNTKQYLIFNEDEGEWKDGIWYSFKTYTRSVIAIPEQKSLVTCTLCYKQFSKKHVYTISNPFGFEKYICADCINEKEIKIGDVITIIKKNIIHNQNI